MFPQSPRHSPSRTPSPICPPFSSKGKGDFKDHSMGIQLAAKPSRQTSYDYSENA